MSYWLPTRPYTIIDAINRMAVATGSSRTAVAGACADYNGHLVRVEWNSYRLYWIASYFWAGTRVLARGDLETCIIAAKREYDRGAKGAMVLATLRDESEYAVAAAHGLVPYSDEIRDAHFATWMDDRFKMVNDAIGMERQFGVPATAILIGSSSADEYKSRLNTVFQERRRMNQS